MLLPELTKHPVAYAVLSTGTVIFLGTFFAVWPNHFYERIVILSYALFYFLWGVITHRSKNLITTNIVKEYGLIALLGALLLLMLTF